MEIALPLYHQPALPFIKLENSSVFNWVVAMSDTHVSLLNEFFFELNTANFNFLITFEIEICRKTSEVPLNKLASSVDAIAISEI